MPKMANNNMGMMPGGKTKSGIVTPMNQSNIQQQESGMKMHDYAGTGMPTARGGAGIEGPGTKDAWPVKRVGK